MHSDLWSSQAQIGPFPSIWFSGAARLRLVRFLKHSIKKVMQFVFCSPQAQIGPVSFIWFKTKHRASQDF